MTPVNVPSLATLTVANNSGWRQFFIRNSVEISFSNSLQRFVFNYSPGDFLVQPFFLSVVILSRTLVKTRSLFLVLSDWRSVSDSSLPIPSSCSHSRQIHFSDFSQTYISEKKY